LPGLTVFCTNVDGTARPPRFTYREIVRLNSRFRISTNLTAHRSLYSVTGLSRPLTPRR